MNTPERQRGGRPIDHDLTDRLLTAGEAILAGPGVTRINSDAVCREVGAGKAGFYRRWRTIDAFLTDILLRAAALEVTHSVGVHVRWPADALADVINHHVNHRLGTVAVGLLSYAGTCDPLRVAWTGPTGPPARLAEHCDEVAAMRLLDASPYSLYRAVAPVIAVLRQDRALSGGKIGALTIDQHVVGILASDLS